jgi:hypothetical protein
MLYQSSLFMMQVSYKIMQSETVYYTLLSLCLCICSLEWLIWFWLTFQHLLFVVKFGFMKVVSFWDHFCDTLSFQPLLQILKSQDNSVGIVTGHRLDDWIIAIRFPAVAGNFSLQYCVQTGSGAHPASYPMGTGGSFPGSKVATVWSWPLTTTI